MTPVPLTADLLAHAVIAAAKAFDMCPIRPCEARGGPARQPLTAAAYALVKAGGHQQLTMTRVLGLGTNAVSQAKARSVGAFRKAAEAAEVVVRDHLTEAPPAQPAACAPTAQPLRIPVEFDEPQLAAPPNPPPALRPKPGAISSFIASNIPPRPKPEPEVGTLRARIMGVLRDAPCTAPNLAILANAKELPISEALAVMEREGVVVPGPVPPQGQRHRSWALAERVSA